MPKSRAMFSGSTPGRAEEQGAGIRAGGPELVEVGHHAGDEPEDAQQQEHHADDQCDHLHCCGLGGGGLTGNAHAVPLDGL